MRCITRAACVLLAAAALAACGGEDEPASTPATTESVEDNARNTARTKLQQCLREQGIDEPAMGSREDEKVQEALDGPCKDLMKDAFGGTDPRKGPEFQDSLTRLKACLRDEGVDTGDGQLDRADPKVAKALDACRDELPANLRGGG